MPTITPITRSAHSDLRWSPFSDLKFASKDVFAPLVLAEVRRAAVQMPLAFMEHQGRVLLIGLQGLKPGQNLFVAPDGRWIPGYMPAVYRSYPFSLPDSEDGQRVLCVDESSNLVHADGSEAFFNDEGGASDKLSDVLNFLTAVAAEREPTHSACALLQELELLKPWKITFQENGEERATGGLMRVDEEAYGALGAESLLRLRDHRALELIHAHLISLQQVDSLRRLIALHQTAFDPEKDDIDELLGLGDKDVIEFGF